MTCACHQLLLRDLSLAIKYTQTTDLRENQELTGPSVKTKGTFSLPVITPLSHLVSLTVPKPTTDPRHSLQILTWIYLRCRGSSLLIKLQQRESHVWHNLYRSLWHSGKCKVIHPHSAYMTCFFPLALNTAIRGHWDGGWAGLHS